MITKSIDGDIWRTVRRAADTDINMLSWRRRPSLAAQVPTGRGVRSPQDVTSSTARHKFLTQRSFGLPRSWAKWFPSQVGHSLEFHLLRRRKFLVISFSLTDGSLGAGRPEAEVWCGLPAEAGGVVARGGHRRHRVRWQIFPRHLPLARQPRHGAVFPDDLGCLATACAVEETEGAAGFPHWLHEFSLKPLYLVTDDGKSPHGGLGDSILV